MNTKYGYDEGLFKEFLKERNLKEDGYSEEFFSIRYIDWLECMILGKTETKTKYAIGDNVGVNTHELQEDGTPAIFIAKVKSVEYDDVEVGFVYEIVYGKEKPEDYHENALMYFNPAKTKKENLKDMQESILAKKKLK